MRGRPFRCDTVPPMSSWVVRPFTIGRSSQASPSQAVAATHNQSAAFRYPHECRGVCFPTKWSTR